MRKPCLVLILIAAVSAFGKPPPYDPASLPAAAALRQHMLNQCGPFRTLRASVDCGLAAHRAYAMTEKLRDMSLFRAYAAIARRAADDVDAGRISQSAAQKIVAAARSDYQDKVQKSYDDFVRLESPAIRPAPFDPGARTRAGAAHDRAVKTCGAWESKAVVEARTICVLAADKAFTTAIGLRDMDLFYGYASFLRVDAADAADGKRDPAQMAAQQQSLWSDFMRTLDQDYAGWKNGAAKAR